MWGSIILVFGAIAIAGAIVVNIDRLFDYFENKNNEDLEWELKKYKQNRK